MLADRADLPRKFRNIRTAERGATACQRMGLAAYVAPLDWRNTLVTETNGTASELLEFARQIFEVLRTQRLQLILEVLFINVHNAFLCLVEI